MMRCLEVDLKDSRMCSAISPTVADFRRFRYESMLRRRAFAKALNMRSSSRVFIPTAYRILLHAIATRHVPVDSRLFARISDKRHKGFIHKHKTAYGKYAACVLDISSLDFRVSRTPFPRQPSHPCLLR